MSAHLLFAAFDNIPSATDVNAFANTVFFSFFFIMYTPLMNYFCNHIIFPAR